MTIRSPFGTPFMSPLASFTGTDDELRRFIINLLDANSTRNSPTTVLGYGPTAVYTDDPILLTVPANLVAIKYGRLVGTEWFDTDINGVKFPNPTELQNYGAGTNQLWPSLIPATQTTASLATGFYTLSCYGAGSALASGGTATITGAAAATEGSPNTIEVTVAGTVTVTVTGALDRFQLEGGSIETAHIITTTAPLTRLADVTTYPTPIVLTPESGAIETIVNPTDTGQQDKAIMAQLTVFNVRTNTLANRIDFQKTFGGMPAALGSYTHSKDVPFRVQIYWDKILGMGIRTADESADITVVAFGTNADTSDMPLLTVLDIGNRSGAEQFIGDYDNDGVPVCFESKEAAGW